MAQAVGNLIVNLIANTGKYTAGLKKAQADAQRFVSQVKGIFATIGGGLAIKSFVGSAIAEFSQAELAATRLRGTLLATGNAAGVSFEKIQSLAGIFAELTIFDDDAITSAAARLASFKNIAGNTFQSALKATLDLSSALGVDLDTAAMQVGKALEHPAEGLAGLARLGIRFSDAQEQAIKSMVEMNNIAGAQAAILDTLQGKFGGLAEAVGNTTAGAIARLSNAFGNLKEAIGETISEAGLPEFLQAWAMVIRPMRDFGGLTQVPERTNKVLTEAARSGNIGEVQRQQAIEDLRAMHQAVMLASRANLKPGERNQIEALNQTLVKLQEWVFSLKPTGGGVDIMTGMGRGITAAAGVFGIIGKAFGEGSSALGEFRKGLALSSLNLMLLATNARAAADTMLREHQARLGRGIQADVAGILRTPETDLAEAMAKILFAQGRGLIGNDAATRAILAAKQRFAEQAYQPIGAFEKGTVAEFSERKRLEATAKAMEMTREQVRLLGEILGAIENANKDVAKDVEQEIVQVVIK